MLPRGKTAPQFSARWDEFCRQAREACALFDLAPSATYKPGENGRGTWVFRASARTVAQAWKVIDHLRRRGWAVKLVPGLSPSITVDLRYDPIEGG